MFEKFKKEIKFNLLFFITVVTGLIFIYSTYAWFSSALNVVISDFRMTTDSTDGIYISLDGITWSDSVDITENNVISLLTDTYPEHKTQWPDKLRPVSAIGLSSADQQRYKFYTYRHHKIWYPKYDNSDVMDFYALNEDEVNNRSPFVAFDVFIKNVTPSPYSDNLYLDVGTKFTNADPDNTDDTALNSLRLGIIFSDVTTEDDTYANIQGLTCNGRCRGFIYEPNAFNHTDYSIETVAKHGVTLKNGDFFPTYGMHTGGDSIKIWSGAKNDKVAIDSEHYQLQNTATDPDDPIFQIPRGIVKARIYVWVEGQDIDIIETESDGYKVSVSINFRKDHASLN